MRLNEDASDGDIFFRQLAETINVVFWLVDVDKQALLYISPGYERIWGRSCASLFASPATWQETIIAEDRERVMTAIRQQGTIDYDIEYRIRRPDGTLRWIHDRSFPVKDTTGKICRLAGVAEDITERKYAEEALRHESQKNTTLLRAAVDGVHILDTEGYVRLMSDSFCQMLGYAHEEMQHMHVSQWDAKWSDAQLRERIGLLIQQGKTFETIHRCKDGRRLDVEVSARHITVDGLSMLYCSSRDITEKKRKDELILKQANYDMITGLPNRHLFHDRLKREIRKTKRTGLPVALLLIDLDHFKEINDTLGHAKGDLLLVEAARRISACVRETDTVARLGGDEFTVILPEFSSRTHIERIAQDIIGTLSNTFLLGGGDIGYISASIGITLCPDDATDVEGLLKHADQAMYMAKTEGRCRYNYFTQSMQQEAQEKVALIHDLRQALVRQELNVYYQPIIEPETGRIVKAEALLRWQHPQRGMVGPAIFIPLAEQSRLILEIGEWVFAQVITDIAHWHKRFGRIVPVSVNKSPLQFSQAAERDWIDQLVKHNLPGNSITVEITEGLLLKESSNLKQRLLEFQRRGIEVSIDDFGTGFSSLSYLKQFDIDYLKIDRSFISGLTNHDSDQALTEAIIVMAHKLGIKTVAEGVETAGQLNLLRSFGCDYAQGFWYSPAVPATEFEKMLRQEELSNV